MRFLAILFLAGAALSQTDAHWLRIEGAGSVTAVLKSGKKWRGAVSDWSPTSVRIAGATASRGDVQRVARKSRPRGVLTGLLAGFAVGMPIGAAAGPYIGDIGNPSAGTRVRHGLGFGLFAGGAGAAIGALTGKQVTLYRAP